MTLDRGKLQGLLAGLAGAGSGAIYRAYLDRLPAMFGSAKLAGEAGLILAALAAAELAHASAAAAKAPVAFEPAGEDTDGAPLFRPTRMAPVGGVPIDWMGVPLYPLACALGRARERMSEDDEVYSASFVYVLFRLKAALGVWRGDATPDARYRLWLKDLAPVVAADPTLGPMVTACHGRIARAAFEASETYLPALRAETSLEPPPVFAAFASTAWYHALAGGEADAGALDRLIATLRAASHDAYRRGQNALQVELNSALVMHAAATPLWPTAACNDLANAYMSRGNAKQSAEGHGPAAAIADYDEAIEIMKALRAALEPKGSWDPPLRNNLAIGLVNRAIAKAGAGNQAGACADILTARDIADTLIGRYETASDPLWQRVATTAARLEAQFCKQV